MFFSRWEGTVPQLDILSPPTHLISETWRQFLLEHPCVITGESPPALRSCSLAAPAGGAAHRTQRIKTIVRSCCREPDLLQCKKKKKKSHAASKSQVLQIFSCTFALQLLQSKRVPVRVLTSFPVNRNNNKKKRAADGSNCGAVEQIYSLARIRRHMAGGHSGSDKWTRP